MNRERLAVIGGGIAGLGAAWLLRKRYDVALFEREKHIGGHSNTVEVQEDGRALPVDTGFMVFNKVTYPHLVRLFDELRVPIKPTEMSFSVRHEGLDLEYNGMGFSRVFAQRANLVRPRFLKLLAQILRFFRVANASLDDDSLESMSLDEFVRRHRLGDDFLRLYLVPMSASIWSITPGRTLDFPAATLVRFFHNHGFLGVTTHHPWFTVDGGSREYVKRMLTGLPQAHALSPVASVEVTADRVKVRTKDGASHDFDRVILAAHADESLALLARPTELQRKLLSAFRYQANETLLHTDTTVMPRRKLAWAAWNYRMEPGEEGERPSTHYYMNRLQGVSDRRDYFVSLNYADRIDPSAVLWRTSYTHPIFDCGALAAQRHLPSINAESRDQRVFFCGSYFRYGFHEDALASAVQCAHAVCGEDPWT
ncbi:MAG: FAD-dependent oxidoreductase [Chthoniobacterales bacterium]|nr:FAD-dependent oxidoreductase [Chthoniobacterales bacterium]